MAKIKHGMTNTKMYARWASIKYRCSEKGGRCHKNYGLRGICMSEEFKNSFLVFYEYVLSLENYCPIKIENKEISIDRINNNGNYERGNLRWANRATQSRNTRLRKDNKTGYRGVEETPCGNYRSIITVNKKHITLGTRKTAKQAYQLRIDYIKKHKLKGFVI